MFFLTTYGVLNIAAGTERFLGSPSFRPKFKVHWAFSFLGAAACIAVMFLINSGATLIALVFVALIFIWLKGRQLQSAWGDIGRGIRIAIIKSSLMKLSEDHDPKNWRPNPMVLAGSPTKRWHLIEFADTFTRNRGILSIASVLPKDSISAKQINNIKTHIRSYLAKNGVISLVKVVTAESPFQGVTSLAESYGMGALEPNTIIIGESENPESRPEFCKMIHRFYELKKNVLIVHKGKEEKTYGQKSIIDVWWGGLKGNGGLMMIIAYLMNNSLDWRQAKIRIKMVVDPSAVEKTELNIANLLEEIRIVAEPHIIPSDQRSFDEILNQSSADADLVFMGLAAPDENFTTYFEQVQDRIKDLPTTVLALAAQEVSFGEVLIQKDSMKDT
jgi:hypothetical protein